MNFSQPNFQPDPEQGEDKGTSSNGNGNRLRDYQLQELKKDVDALTEKVDSLKDEIAKLPLALLKWLTPVLIASLAFFVGLVTLVYNLVQPG